MPTETKSSVRKDNMANEFIDFYRNVFQGGWSDFNRKKNEEIRQKQVEKVKKAEAKVKAEQDKLDQKDITTITKGLADTLKRDRSLIDAIRANASGSKDTTANRVQTVNGPLGTSGYLDTSGTLKVDSPLSTAQPAAREIINAIRTNTSATRPANRFELVDGPLGTTGYLNPNGRLKVNSFLSQGQSNSQPAATSQTRSQSDGPREDFFDATGIRQKDKEKAMAREQEMQSSTPANSTNNADNAESSDVIEYTYKPGDTFGQVINDLGLRTNHGLWGPNGDVEYYTKQLEDQLWKSGVWPAGERQNIPVGTTIRLKRRNN